MGERGSIRVPFGQLLLIVLVALLAAPVAALAASGLPATVNMTPASAGPGSEVEVTGLDFPPNQSIELTLTTTAGPVMLGAAQTVDDGYFRQTVTLPPEAPAGFWELRATASDGSVAVMLFEAGSAGPASAAVSPAPVSPGGNSLSDILVMLVFALLIAGVGGGAAYVYYQSRLGNAQPGMSDGADPIWSGASTQDLDPALSATDTPAWTTTSKDNDEANLTAAPSES